MRAVCYRCGAGCGPIFQRLGADSQRALIQYGTMVCIGNLNAIGVFPHNKSMGSYKMQTTCGNNNGNISICSI